MQEVPQGRKDSPGGPWQFIGLMPLFDPPRHDSAETIRRALNLGVNVKMITGIFWFPQKLPSKKVHNLLILAVKLLNLVLSIRGSTGHWEGNWTTLGNGNKHVSCISFTRTG